MKKLLNVSISSKNSRIEFVLDTLCEWYGWQWTYTDSEKRPNALNFSYGFPVIEESSFSIQEPFPISEVGKPDSTSEWGEFLGVPNPCQSDPISGVFYLLTCAEEYTVDQKDKHNRVRASDLSLVRKGHAGIPLADRLVEVLAKAIWETAGFDGTPEMKPVFGYSSLDIDQVYAIRHKAIYKQIGNLARASLSHGWSAGLAVAKAIFGKKDPFDQFDWIKSQHERRGLRPYLFMLMGYENSLDQAWNPGHHAWPAFIDELLQWASLGIHPSYYTSTDAALLRAERTRLEGLVGTSVYRSRQHYLKVAWPETFQSLESGGILEDYTLAWPDCLGFRMGTARSCYWYDLVKDEKTSLRLHPPALMEVTGRFYLGLSPKQFLKTASDLAEEAEKSNSGLRIIWHNSNLSAVGGWTNWRKIYPKILDLIAK